MGNEDTPPVAAPSKEKAEPITPLWLVIISDESDTAPRCIRCENEASLSRALTEHVLASEVPLHAFAFKGQRVAISSPRPICSFKVGDKKVDVGQDSDEYDESGLITPLARAKPAE